MNSDEQIKKIIEQREKALVQLQKGEISYEQYKQINQEFLDTLGCNH